MADETQQPDSTQPSSLPVEPGPASPSPTGTDPTSGDPAAPAPVAGGAESAPAEVARPVLVNNFTSRDDNDALLGGWVDVIAGDYEGRFGAYQDDVSHDPQTGYPDQVLVRTRDAENELIQVNYADIRPSARTGGR